MTSYELRAAAPPPEDAAASSASAPTAGPPLSDSDTLLAVQRAQQHPSPTLDLEASHAPYDERAATAHVRRLLDLVSPARLLGPPAEPWKRPFAGEVSPQPNQAEGAAASSSGSAAGAGGRGAGGAAAGYVATSACPEEAAATAALRAAVAASDAPDAEPLLPPPTLAGFYGFLSLGNVEPPVDGIERVELAPEAEDDSDRLFCCAVRAAGAPELRVVACAEGFYAAGERSETLCPTLVALLRLKLHGFQERYSALLRAMQERNPHGNVPAGLRRNTWCAPPGVGERGQAALPAEDPAWGGHGGGWGRDEATHAGREWAREFAAYALERGVTADERQARDRRVFLAHAAFVDVAVRHATDALASCVDGGDAEGVAAHARETHNIEIEVQDCAEHAAAAASSSSGAFSGVDDASSVAALLKGVCADVNTPARDVRALGTVAVRQLGRVVVARAVGLDACAASAGAADAEVEDATRERYDEAARDEGANALNLHSLRVALNEHASPDYDAEVAQAEAAVMQLAESNKGCLGEEASEAAASAAAAVPIAAFRWEFGQAWVQHLREQKRAREQKASSPGSGAGARARARSQANARGGHGAHANASLARTPAAAVAEVEADAPEEGAELDEDSALSACEAAGVHAELVEAMGVRAALRLARDDVGLHTMSVAELVAAAKSHYEGVALPKLLAELRGLELSPIDGRTLTEFLHARGIGMRSLGRIVEATDGLRHMQEVSLAEVIARSAKVLLRAAMATHAKAGVGAAARAAAVLNGVLCEADTPLARAVWGWLVRHARVRFGADLSAFAPPPESAEGAADSHATLAGGVLPLRGAHLSPASRAVRAAAAAARAGAAAATRARARGQRSTLRRLALMRALCTKVGLEVVTRAYDFGCEDGVVVRAHDVLSAVPVLKQVAPTSADGRALLEASKAALDKGRLEHAAALAARALVRAAGVCGARHRASAGARSLLAVALYHTGDFSQAAAYQQTALDTCERELGLDHPDTIKAYGDLAVFYYRLQRTELALVYVRRSLQLLGMACGAEHPNTAATFINIAMMEEGCGQTQLALRYLHEALACNRRLLGRLHVQTAAAYHALAIALSLSEAYGLSVSHEQTTLNILEASLGADDPRTLDAQAWLEYFDSKQVERNEARQAGRAGPDRSIASRGHLALNDLVRFIEEEETTAADARLAVEEALEAESNAAGATTEAASSGSEGEARADAGAVEDDGCDAAQDKGDMDHEIPEGAEPVTSGADTLEAAATADSSDGTATAAEPTAAAGISSLASDDLGALTPPESSLAGDDWEDVVAPSKRRQQARDERRRAERQERRSARASQSTARGEVDTNGTRKKSGSTSKAGSSARGERVAKGERGATKAAPGPAPARAQAHAPAQPAMKPAAPSKSPMAPWAQAAGRPAAETAKTTTESSGNGSDGGAPNTVLERAWKSSPDNSSSSGQSDGAQSHPTSPRQGRAAGASVQAPPSPAKAGGTYATMLGASESKESHAQADGTSIDAAAAATTTVAKTSAETSSSDKSSEVDSSNGSDSSDKTSASKSLSAAAAPFVRPRAGVAQATGAALAAAAKLGSRRATKPSDATGSAKAQSAMSPKKASSEAMNPNAVVFVPITRPVAKAASVAARVAASVAAGAPAAKREQPQDSPTAAASKPAPDAKTSGSEGALSSPKAAPAPAPAQEKKPTTLESAPAAAPAAASKAAAPRGSWARPLSLATVPASVHALEPTATPTPLGGSTGSSEPASSDCASVDAGASLPSEPEAEETDGFVVVRPRKQAKQATGSRSRARQVGGARAGRSKRSPSGTVRRPAVSAA